MKFFFVTAILVFLLFNCSTKTIETLEIPNFYTSPIINDSLVMNGKTIFERHCHSCHSMEINTSKAPDISDVLRYHEPSMFYLYLLGEKNQKLLSTSRVYPTPCVINDSINKQEAIALTEYLKQYQNWLHEINSRFK